jgi:hypothetical protein
MGRSLAVVGQDIPGPVFDFLVNFGDVIADNAQTNHQQTADEQL